MSAGRRSLRLALAGAALALGCQQAPANTDMRFWTDNFKIRVATEPAKPFAREKTVYKVVVLDLALFSDFAQRAGMKGIQEWLSFYFKSPMAAPGLQPEHDLFIQQTKLKNTLRYLMGEKQITHLGIEYYLED